MKKSLIAIILLGVCGQSLATLGVINISITANLVANTCSVSLASRDQTVNMGEWADKQFANNPTTAPRPFLITFENCDAGARGVKITFNGSTAPADSSLLALSGAGAARNVALAILDKNMRRLVPGRAGEIYGLRPVAQGQSIQFYGQYVATALPVAAGAANAQATFAVEYQ